MAAICASSMFTFKQTKQHMERVLCMLPLLNMMILMAVLIFGFALKAVVNFTGKGMRSFGGSLGWHSISDPLVQGTFDDQCWLPSCRNFFSGASWQHNCMKRNGEASGQKFPVIFEPVFKVERGMRMALAHKLTPDPFHPILIIRLLREVHDVSHAYCQAYFIYQCIHTVHK